MIAIRPEIKINANGEYCGDCVWRIEYNFYQCKGKSNCPLFQDEYGDNIQLAESFPTWERCQQCLKAEVKE